MPATGSFEDPWGAADADLRPEGDRAATAPSDAGPGMRGPASRFRRPERPAPAGASPDAHVDLLHGEADPRSNETALATPGADGRSLGAMAEPLAALAAAFQANAEALRRTQEIQADLGRALQRADRSEAMVQNTAALNDTFKGLTQVQRSLLHSVDEADRATRAHRWFLPTLVLSSLVVVGAALWLVVHRMDEVETDVIGRGDVASQLAAARREGEAAAKEGLADSFATERRALEARLADRENDLRTAKAEATATAAKMKQLESDLLSASNEIQGARNDSLRAKALENELNQLRVEAAVKGPEAERLRIELEAEKRTVAELRRRLADVSLGRVSGDSSEGGAVPSETSPRDGSEAVRDRRSLDGVRGRLNDVLKASAAARPDYLQLTGLESVSGLRLSDVTVVRYAATGKPVSTYRAKELRITVDRTRRIVEFAFRDGGLDYAGSNVPFPGGAMTVVVAEGDSISSWLQSGLTFVGSK